MASTFQSEVTLLARFPIQDSFTACLSLAKRRMETLDEFDNEYPLSMSFCKLISPEDFEVQSLSYTEQCLQELYTNMEQSPGICERVMRKRKQMEKEASGLASFLKVAAVPS